MKYQTVEKETGTALDDAVNDLIAEGWEPIGGVAIAAVFSSYENERKGYTESETNYTYMQAMIHRGSAA